jgi:hypothetical protein
MDNAKCWIGWTDRVQRRLARAGNPRLSAEGSWAQKGQLNFSAGRDYFALRGVYFALALFLIRNTRVPGTSPKRERVRMRMTTNQLAQFRHCSQRKSNLKIVICTIKMGTLILAVLWTKLSAV